MPDFLAGTIITALDTPPTVENTQNGGYAANITAYGTATTSGSYVDCGVAFTAPTTGRVLIKWRGQLDHDGTGVSPFSALSPRVGTGATVGAGTSVLAADDSRAIIQSGTDLSQNSQEHLLSGLTPGDPYNVRLMHRVGSGNGTFERRQVIVAPAS